MSDEGPRATDEEDEQFDTAALSGWKDGERAREGLPPDTDHPFEKPPTSYGDFCWHQDESGGARCGWPEADHPAVEDGTEELTAEAIVQLFSQFITSLEPADLDGVIEAIDAEPLPVGDDRRAAAMNRADRAELVRLFKAVRDSGRGIVRRLQDDQSGKVRDE